LDTRERIKFRIGFSRMEKKYEWKDHVIFMGLLLALAVWVNHGIQIKGLYMDDHRSAGDLFDVSLQQ
jgi:hypothetical protein